MTEGSRASAAYCFFKCLKGQRAAIPTDVIQLHEAKMAVAALERSFIEICGFERETLHRFRELTVDQGKSLHTLHAFDFSKRSLLAEERGYHSTEQWKLATC